MGAGWTAAAGRAAPRGGTGLTLWSPADTALAAPVVTVPGQIVAVHWSPGSQAAVVISAPDAHAQPPAPGQPSGWDATLIIASRQSHLPRTLRLAPPPPAPLGLAPLTWEAHALLWATTNGARWELERIAFATGLPERLGLLPAGTLAVHTEPDGAIRLLVFDGQLLTLRDWPADAIVLTIDDLSVQPPLGSAWQDTTMVIATQEQIWELTYAPAALR